MWVVGELPPQGAHGILRAPARTRPRGLSSRSLSAYREHGGTPAAVPRSHQEG